MTPLSMFVHRFTVDDREYLYNSLSMEIYDSPESLPAPDLETEMLEALRGRAAEDKGIVMGTLFLTTRCPRQCGYCFLEGVGQGDMTGGEIDRALGLMRDGPGDILLYGGEPLLRPDLVAYTAERIRETRGDVNLILITGGIPVDRSLAELLSSLDTFVIVSMDGSPRENNLCRPLKDPGDSFAQAERAFNVFREAGCRVGISVTLSRLNITEARRNFIWLMDRFQPDDMGLNPWLHPLEKGNENPHQIRPEEAILAVTSCMEEALSRGMYVEQLARRTRPFVNRSPRLKDCASSGGRLVVMPGGIAGTCDCMTCRGHHGVSLNDRAGIEELMRGFRTLAPVFFPLCLSCPALTICGGGCRYDAFSHSGDLRGRWPDRCRFERQFLNWMLSRTVREGRESLIPRGGFSRNAMPMPVGTMLGESK